MGSSASKKSSLNETIADKPNLAATPRKIPATKVPNVVRKGNDATVGPSQQSITSQNTAARVPMPIVQWIAKDAKPTESEIQQTVRNCWNLIDYQTKQARAEDFKQASSPVIRVFVSSTFTDMHNEREILVKKVFPLLRDWCISRGLSLIETDLRWGVPKDSTTADTISTCLSELDRCHEQNGGEPFFIGLLSERYGWVPTESEIPDALKEKYHWVPNVSITHMEILHGAWRKRNASAAFFLRDGAVMKTISKEQIGKFEDTQLLNCMQLKELKRKILEEFGRTQQCFNYTTNVDHTGNSSSVKLSGLDSFAENVLKFLQARIEKRYPITNPEDATFDLEAEQRVQELFLRNNNASFVGREAELDTIRSYINKNADQNAKFEKLPLEMTNTSDDEKGVHEFGVCPWLNNGNPLLYVGGVDGIGKSALLAKISSEFKTNKNTSVFYHFPSAATSSGDARLLILRLIQFTGCKTKCPPKDEEYEFNLMPNCPVVKIWKTEALPMLEKKQGKVVLLLDALDQIDTGQAPSHLHWLPQHFPPNVFCICSARTGESIAYVNSAQQSIYDKSTISRLESRGSYRMILEGLINADKELYAEKYLAQYNKKLDPEQKLSLMSASPDIYWLSLALEELRIYGDFRTVTQKISQMPMQPKIASKDITDSKNVVQTNVIFIKNEGIIKEIVQRILREDTTKHVEKALCCLACSRKVRGTKFTARMNGYEYTIHEADLPFLLSEKSDEPISAMDWRKTRVALGKLVKIDRQSHIEFAKEVVFQVVCETLLKNEPIVLMYHKKLAMHFDRQLNVPDHALSRPIGLYCAYHLCNARMIREVVDLFLFDDRVTYPDVPSWKLSEKREIMQDIMCGSTIQGVVGTDDNAAFICNNCRMRMQNAWIRSGQSACLLCGQTFDCKPGRVCQRHYNRHMASCVTCGNHSANEPVKICSQCNFGVAKCCYLAGP